MRLGRYMHSFKGISEVCFVNFWGKIIGRIWLGVNRCINMDTRDPCCQPRIKTEGGIEGQENYVGMELS